MHNHASIVAIGAGTGLAAGAVVDSKAGPGNWLPNIGKEVLSPLGALIGTVIGVALPTREWREVYRVP